jgi:Family of unknown function (DUF6311)
MRVTGAQPSSAAATMPQTALLLYFVAFLIGLSVAIYIVPVHSIFALDPFAHAMRGDVTQSIIAQRYYIHDAWRWPLLNARSLVTPDGTNVAFMDAIPLILIPLKVVRHFLPPGFTGIYLWLAFCFLMQPVAAVFALRSAGERRFLPGLAVAVISISMPTLIFRFGHTALCSHFLILIALGLYFQIVQRAAWKPIVAGLLVMVCSLLVHPYIMYMVMAVLAAAPITLLLRRDRRAIPVAATILGGIAITGIIAVELGYGKATPMAGFGYYSMNLFSPLYPYGSSILRGIPALDATGGQGEGYQYLGLGVLFMIVLCDFILGPREKLRLLQRNAGMVIVCISLTLLALSTKIYAGNQLILKVGPDNLMLQFRTSGRFFWPVAYFLVIGGIVLLARHLSRRTAWIVLAIVAVVQFIDTSQMRRHDRHELRASPAWVLDTQQLRPLLAEHSSLSVWPKFLCGADHLSPPFVELGLLASETALPIDTAYVGRTTGSENCKTPPVPMPVDPGNLLVLLPPGGPALSRSVDDWQDLCKQIGVLVACSQKLRGRSDLSTPAIPGLPVDKNLSTAANGEGLEALRSGWSAPEGWGLWTDGPVARMLLQPNAPPDAPVLLTVRAHGLALQGQPQKVAVWVDGKYATMWQVLQGAERDYSVALPPRASSQTPISVELRVEDPVTPKQLGLGNDERRLGLGMYGFELKTDSTKAAARHS